MAEPKITVQIRTVADTSGTDKTTTSLDKATGAAGKATDALEQTGKAATDTAGKMDAAGKAAEKAADTMAEATGEAASQTGDSLDEMFKRAKGIVDGSLAKMQEAKEEAGEAGDAAGEGFAKGVEGKVKDIQWTQDAMGAATKAWELGSLIGDEIGKAMTYALNTGSFDGFMDHWVESVASKMGIITDAWEVNLKKIKDSENQSLADSRKQYLEWRDSLSKAPAQDAVTWLGQVKQEAQAAQTALRELQALQAAVRRASLDKIGQDEADALDAIDADPVLPESRKIKERQRVKAEAEMQRLRERQNAREEERAGGFKGVLSAKDQLETTRLIETAQIKRGTEWSEIKAAADKLGRGPDGELDKDVAQQQFDSVAKSRGVTDMQYGDDEQAKAKQAIAAREQAESALAEAERQQSALRSRLAVDDASDIDSTQRSLSRGAGQADRQSTAVAGQEAAAVQAEAQRQKDAETQRLQGIGNESATQAVADLDQLSAAAKDPAFKQKLEELRATLTDADGATAFDVQRIQQYLESLKTSNVEGQRLIANTLGSMADVQLNFNSQITSLKAQVEQLQNQMRNY